MNEYIEAWINGLEISWRASLCAESSGPSYSNAKDYNLTSVGPGRGRDENRPPINGEGLAES